MCIFFTSYTLYVLAYFRCLRKNISISASNNGKKIKKKVKKKTHSPLPLHFFFLILWIDRFSCFSYINLNKRQKLSDYYGGVSQFQDQWLRLQSFVGYCLLPKVPSEIQWLPDPSTVVKQINIFDLILVPLLMVSSCDRYVKNTFLHFSSCFKF